MTAIVPEHATAPSTPGPRIALHVDDALGIADVSVDGPVAPEDLARVAAELSCRLHAAIAQARTGVVVDLGRAPGCDADEAAVARVLDCARDGAAARGLALDLV